jgi:hypothetical protein
MYDESKAEKLSTLLGELNAARPDQKNAIPGESGNDVYDQEYSRDNHQDTKSEGVFPPKRPRGRPRKRPLGESYTDANDESTKSRDCEESVAKRPRGRPRKHPLPVDDKKDPSTCKINEESVEVRQNGRPDRRALPQTTSPGEGRFRENDDSYVSCNDESEAKSTWRSKKRSFAKSDDDEEEAPRGKRQFKRQKQHCELDSAESSPRRESSISEIPRRNGSASEAGSPLSKQAEREKRRQWRRVRWRKSIDPEDDEEEPVIPRGGSAAVGKAAAKKNAGNRALARPSAILEVEFNCNGSVYDPILKRQAK